MKFSKLVLQSRRTITDFEDPQLVELSSYVIKLPHLSDNTAPILKILPLQLITYEIAVLKGLNPDSPKQLKKAIIVS